MLVGFWPEDEAILHDERLRAAVGADYYTSSLHEAVEQCVKVLHGAITDGQPTDQIARMRHPKPAVHLRAVQITLRLRDVDQDVELIFRDEQLQFTHLGEIRLGREQRHTGEPIIAIARHHGGGDAEQGTAEAVAGGLNSRIATVTAPIAAMTPRTR